MPGFEVKLAVSHGMQSAAVCAAVLISYAGLLQNGHLQFSLSDTGMGLPMEKVDQIFSAFLTTKPQAAARGWPSAVRLWSRMAGSCGQALMMDEVQPSISRCRPM
jgi:hypothetical protein